METVVQRRTLNAHSEIVLQVLGIDDEHIQEKWNNLYVYRIHEASAHKKLKKNLSKSKQILKTKPGQEQKKF